jgi:hypothetical protein
MIKSSFPKRSFDRGCKKKYRQQAIPSTFVMKAERSDHFFRLFFAQEIKVDPALDSSISDQVHAWGQDQKIKNPSEIRKKASGLT